MDKFEKLHRQLIGKYAQEIEEIYNSAIREAAAMGASISDFDISKPFTFKDYPQIKARVENLLKSMNSDIVHCIANGVETAFILSNTKNNAIAKPYKHLFQNNFAQKAFVDRTIKGMGLSEKVWNLTQQFKGEMEMGLGIGIKDGTSAAQLAREMKQYLNDPDKLFRRVRDEYGQLHLSKAAAAYNPGEGTYRSSYKNALRMTRTEINMAYRTADYERWRNMDFVLGIEIQLSGSHPQEDICDELAGNYPKDFKFVGWHPQCFCIATPILEDFKTSLENDKRIAEGKEPIRSEAITDVPDKFKEWVAKNEGRIEKAYERGKVPYFIRDNEKYINAKAAEKTMDNNTPTAQNNLSNIQDKTNKLQSAYPELTDKITEVENQIRMNKAFETLVSFDKDGNITLDLRGEEKQVSWAGKGHLMKDCMVTHNHPLGWRHNDIRRIGGSFSWEDLKTTIICDVAEFRAVTPHYTFSLKRPENGLWGVSINEFNRIWYDENEKLKFEFMNRISDRTLTVAQAETTHFHILNKRLSQRFGWEYTKLKTR